MDEHFEMTQTSKHYQTQLKITFDYSLQLKIGQKCFSVNLQIKCEKKL